MISELTNRNLIENRRTPQGLDSFRRILSISPSIKSPSILTPFGGSCLSHLQLSHLRFHKFKHSFQDTLNPICSCGIVETTVHYLLHCPNFSNERLTLFDKLQSIDANILSKGNSNISKLLLYGDHSFNNEKNTSILTASIDYIILTKRFDAPFFLKLIHLLAYV